MTDPSLAFVDIHWLINDANLEEVIIRNEIYSSDEAQRILENINVIWPPSHYFPNTVNFIYVDFLEQPEIVKYNISDLSNAFKIIAAISTYHSQNVRNRMNQEQIEEYMETHETFSDHISLSDYLNAGSGVPFNGLKHLDQEIYFVSIG